MVLVSGTHGANAEHRTEIDSFSKVLFFGSDPARGPERWEVRTKPCRVIDYGSSADSNLNTQDRSPSVASSTFGSTADAVWLFSDPALQYPVV